MQEPLYKRATVRLLLIAKSCCCCTVPARASRVLNSSPETLRVGSTVAFRGLVNRKSTGAL